VESRWNDVGQCGERPDSGVMAAEGSRLFPTISPSNSLQVTPKEGGGVQYSVIPLHHLREHRDSVEALAWSPSGKTLVTGAQKSLYIWDTEVSDDEAALLKGTWTQSVRSNGNLTAPSFWSRRWTANSCSTYASDTFGVFY